MRYFSLLVLFFSVVSLSAQTKFVVSDGDLGGPLPNAHIKVSSEAQTKGFMVVANEKGVATLDDHPELGNPIYIKVSYIGFSDHFDTIQQGETYKIKMYEASESLEQMVVTGQYGESSTEKAIHKITVIDQKKIESLNAVTLDDVLARELNMNISRDNVLGSSISIQGLSGENVKILVDGVPMVGRLNGNIDLSQINLSDIERIEVVEGPLSVTYGSNALAGTINLITKKEQKKKLSVSANSYFENIGTANVDARIGVNHKNWFGSASYNRNFFNGWNIGDPIFKQPEPVADSSRVKLWKPRTQNQINVKIGRKYQKGSVLFAGSGFHEIIYNLGAPSGPYKERAFDDRYTTRRLDLSATWNHLFDTATAMQIIASRNFYDRKKSTYNTDLTGVDYTFMPERSDTNEVVQYMTRATLNKTPIGKNFTYQLGIDLNNETITGQRIQNNEQSIGDYAAFASMEYGLGEKWILRPGLRASYNTKYGAPLVPSFYAKYNLHPGMAIRGSVARGFRAPSVKELYMDFVDINHNINGNPNLKAETAFHASTNFSYTRIHKNTLIKFKFGLFYNHINDKITLARVDDQGQRYEYQNVDEALSVGGNTEVQYGIGHLKTTVGFSYTGNQNQTYESNTPSKLVFSPQVTSNVSYAFKESGVDLALFLKHSGRVPQFVLDENQQLREEYIDQYTLLDFTAKKKLWESKVSVSAGVKNILNVTNVATGNSNSTHGSDPGMRPIAPGRVYFLKLGLRL